MHGNIIGFAVVAIVASISAAAAAGCDTEILKSNMRSQKQNNPEAAQKYWTGMHCDARRKSGHGMEATRGRI